MAKVQVSILGMPRAGKTTFLGCMSCACDIRGHNDPRFFHNIVEHSSGIRSVPDEMRDGRFPKPTPPGQIYEADFVMKFRRRIGFDTLTLPVVETAGEDVNRLIEAINKGEYQTDEQGKFARWADNFYAHILDSKGFVIIVPCDGIRGIPRDGPPSDAPMESADLTITRLIENIMEYKVWTHRPKVTGIALIFSKYDLVKKPLGFEGITLDNPNDRERLLSTDLFTKKYLPSTYNLMRFHQEEVKASIYLPSYVNLASHSWPDGSPRIDVDHRTRQPSFSNYYYNMLINWLHNTFAA